MRFISPLFLCVLLAACGDDKGDFTPVEGCEQGERRCNNGLLEECRSTAWAVVERCLDQGLSCEAERGCVACAAGVESTCVGTEVHACNADGSIGDLIETCITQACTFGKCVEDGCSAEAKLIYLVDDRNNFMSFSPANDAHAFTPIATLDCPLNDPYIGGSPFSMSVDREGKAWVLYNTGEIFYVNTKTGQCAPSNHVPGQSGYELFGMGFVSNAPGSADETLYIFGGKEMALDRGNLATIDPATLQLDTIGPLALRDQSPELTGTGNAKLFGYFPGAGAFVAEIDKTTGTFLQEWPVPDVGQVTAWAFAHWGGRFYLFVTAVASTDWVEKSMVLRLDPKDGKVDTVVEEVPLRIVGAGVSTCAPVIN